MDEARGTSLNTQEDILRAISAGARVLVRTTNGLNGIGSGVDSCSIAITEWTDALSREHGLNWYRLGADVLFTAVS